MTSLKKEMINGVMWTSIAKYSGLVISLIITMILARILTPQEFGVVAIATVIITFLSMLCQMGIGPAIIQFKDLTTDDLDDIFSFSFYVGLLLALFFFFGSWSIASFYNVEQLVEVCQILSINVFFSAINMVPNALMFKDKRFKENAIRTLILQVLTGVISVTAAFIGFGLYALLITPVFTAIGMFLYNRHFYPVQFKFFFSLKPILRIFSYSSYEFLFEFFNYFSRNLDKLIIGRYLSAVELGYYEKSYSLMQLPMSNVPAVINPVLQPVLKDLHNQKELLADKYLKITRLIAIISFPIGFIFWGMADEIIYVFFGNQWTPAAGTLAILSLSLPLQMIQSTSGAIFLICSETKKQFYVGIRNTIITVVSFIIAAFFFKSIEAIAWAWTISLLINFVITYSIIYRYVLNVKIVSFFKILQKPLLIGLILGCFFYLFNLYTSIDNKYLLLIIKGISSLLLAIVFIHLFKLLNVYYLLHKVLSKFIYK
ncbi:lipopolysaccharide biosynthesis protein [Bacteroides sp. GD17]|jgi:O-antigen/teichoic acid export membrane protein|uniref:lipopolysaccharide biosynthesis protein n=1 Tax=Bacteroides sp. GD17 TaxID=3139826 RepID=UPI0025D027A4|nr:lipopolysaccharide biosynthesis protein [uncultured Bacteroides sp.]